MDYAMASPSLAHTYGNVSCFVTEWLKTLFPKNYFKTTHVSSTIAYRNFSRFNNSKKEFIKKSKPMLIIRPRIEIDNDEGFLKDTYFTTRMLDCMDSGDWGNLQEFIHDDNNGRYVKFLMNRLNINFDVSIVVETQMEQINMVHYFKNRIRQGRPFFLNTSLESFIPRDIVALLAKDIAVPLKDDMGHAKPILDYMNGNATYPVTYKCKNSTGTDEFFRYHPTSIDTVITNLSIDDGSKKGFVSDNFMINFTVNCEFSTAGLYYYFTKNKEIIDNFEPSIDEGPTNTMVPIFTVSNIYEELPPGWHVYMSPMYMVDGTQPEELPFSELLNTSLMEVINYHKVNGIPYDIFLDATVMKGNKVMSEEKGEYKIDWDNLVLTTYNCNPSSTYRLILNTNTYYINNLIADLMNIDDEK